MQPLWKAPLSARGLGGVTATDRFVLVGDRDTADRADVFHCLAADTGRVVWTFRHPAPGQLDYGATPRASPVVVGERVYLFGAFGHLHCVELATGKALWQVDLGAEFGPPQDRLPWGLCATPLVAGGKVIVAPGSAQASLAALDAKTGATLWKAPGAAPGYGSFIVAELGGARQIVGHDADSLGGWDLATGQRLWRIVPPKPNDYNVPTPIIWQGKLIVCTENNGTRMFAFEVNGKPAPRPRAVNKELTPETQSPVVVGNLLWGVSNGLHALDLSDGLKKLWSLEDDALNEHAALVAAERRLLIWTQCGELLLVDVSAGMPRIISRCTPIDGDRDLYSHPALVGRRIYLRGNEAIYAFELGGAD